MKQLTNLKADVADAPWLEPHGIISTVHDEPRPGVFRQVQLGGAGLTIRHNKTVVGIPLAAIIALAETAEPLLNPPVEKNT
jgi:hypothetical protein